LAVTSGDDLVGRAPQTTDGVPDRPSSILGIERKPSYLGGSLKFAEKVLSSGVSRGI
jgi:hypothetical protein